MVTCIPSESEFASLSHRENYGLIDLGSLTTLLTCVLTTTTTTTIINYCTANNPTRLLTLPPLH